MPITPFSFTDPTLPPEKQTEAQALLRRQAITQQLLGQGVQYPTQPGVRAPALAPFVQALQGLAMSRNLTGTERGLQAIQQQAATGMAGEQEAYRKRFEGTPVETDVADNIVSGVMPDRTGAIKDALLSKYPLMRQFGEREYTAEAARAQHARDISQRGIEAQEAIRQRAREAEETARVTAGLRVSEAIPADWERHLPPDTTRGPTPGTFYDRQGNLVQMEFKNKDLVGVKNVSVAPRAVAAASRPVLTPIADPKDPKRSITVDVTKFDRDRYLAGDNTGVVGVSPKEPDVARREARLRAEMPKARGQMAGVMQSLNRLNDNIQELHDDPGLSRITGPVMGRLPNLTAQATGPQATLNMIKSNIFQAALQQMRELSKTGGALGSVTDREGDKLERTMAALDQEQGTPKFKAELKKAQKQLQESMEIIQRQFDETYGHLMEESEAGRLSPEEQRELEMLKKRFPSGGQ